MTIFLANSIFFGKPKERLMENNLNDFEKEMEQVLLTSRTELLNKIQKNNEAIDTLANDSNGENNDSVDLASDELAKRSLLAINRQDASTLNSIEHAIVRIKNGNYGNCALCGKSINKERLRAVPYAVLCYDCKIKQEKENRHIS